MRGREGLLFSEARRQLELRGLCLEETEDRVGVVRPRGPRRAESRGLDLTGG